MKLQLKMQWDLLLTYLQRYSRFPSPWGSGSKFQALLLSSSSMYYAKTELIGSSKGVPLKSLPDFVELRGTFDVIVWLTIQGSRGALAGSPPLRTCMGYACTGGLRGKGELRLLSNSLDGNSPGLRLRGIESIIYLREEKKKQFW